MLKNEKVIIHKLYGVGELESYVKQLHKFKDHLSCLELVVGLESEILTDKYVDIDRKISICKVEISRQESNASTDYSCII